MGIWWRSIVDSLNIYLRTIEDLLEIYGGLNLEPSTIHELTTLFVATTPFFLPSRAALKFVVRNFGGGKGRIRCGVWEYILPPFFGPLNVAVTFWQSQKIYYT